MFKSYSLYLIITDNNRPNNNANLLGLVSRLPNQIIPVQPRLIAMLSFDKYRISMKK